MTSVVAEPLAPRRKWLAITLGTLVFVPAFWALLAGLVADAAGLEGGPAPAAAVGLGLALVPFVFMAVAFVSSHRSAPLAVVKAMGVCLLVGVVVSALAVDAVTGTVAGVGAGGAVSLRADPGHSWRWRAVAVAVATVYAFILVRTVGAMALLTVPVLPLTGIGVADHLAERRLEPV